jgi:hypothetical protein
MQKGLRLRIRHEVSATLRENRSPDAEGITTRFRPIPPGIAVARTAALMQKGLRRMPAMRLAREAARTAALMQKGLRRMPAIRLAREAARTAALMQKGLRRMPAMRLAREAARTAALMQKGLRLAALLIILGEDEREPQP